MRYFIGSYISVNIRYLALIFHLSPSLRYIKLDRLAVRQFQSKVTFNIRAPKVIFCGYSYKVTS